MRWAAVVAAAGSGSRLGFDTPKGFLELSGKPLVAWSVETFKRLEGCVQVVAAVPQGFRERACAVLREPGVMPPEGPSGPAEIQVVCGGKRRQDSVWEALKEIHESVEVVAVHDAARPLTAAGDIQRTLKTAFKCGGCILARAVTDTLKRVEGDRIVGRADRRSLWRAETPQAFKLGLLKEAYAGWKGGLATDEAEIVGAAGKEVRVVEAESWNPKITFPSDLEVLHRVLGRKRTVDLGGGDL